MKDAIPRLAADDAGGIAVDEASNAYVLAHFRNTVTLPGCGAFMSKGNSDLLLMKLSP